jgi:uncharacterized protein DUF4397
MTKRLLALLLGALTLGAFAFVAAPAGAAGSDGTVYVVHGVPKTPVDVYVNNKVTLQNFQPGKVAGPLTLPAGDYAIAIRPAGAAASSAPVIAANVTLPAGANASLVAHLDASAKPTLTTFVNDLSAAPAGQGRLVVRHTAAAPAVDVLANGSPAFTNLVNGKEASANLPAGTISASVVAAGTTSPALIGPADVPVVAGMSTIVYAIGAPASGGTASTLGVVTQQLALSGSDAMVNTGTSGLRDHNGAVPAVAWFGIGLAAIASIGSGVALRRARVHAR